MNENPVDMIIEHSGIDVSRYDPAELERMRAYCAELIDDVTRLYVRKAVEGIVGSFDEPGTFTQENFDKLKRMINPYPERIKYTSTDLRQSVYFPFDLDKIKPIICTEGVA